MKKGVNGGISDPLGITSEAANWTLLMYKQNCGIQIAVIIEEAQTRTASAKENHCL